MSFNELPYVYANIPKSGKMLDIGSKMDSKHYPPYHMMFTFQTKGYDVSVIDKNDNLPEKDIYKCDIEEESLPFKDRTFDIVLLMQVIEHLGRDSVHALLEIKRVLKLGGTLIVTTPNFFALNNIKSLIFKREQQDFSSLISQHKYKRNYTAHIRVYTKNELKQLIEFAGLKVEKIIFMHRRDTMMVVCKHE